MLNNFFKIFAGSDLIKTSGLVEIKFGFTLDKKSISENHLLIFY